jgi:hypothetical protein
MASREMHLCTLAAKWVAGHRIGGGLSENPKPDQLERDQPAVDAWFTDNVGDIFVEHTLIEPFPGQQADDIRFNEFFGKFFRRFGDGLPKPGYYVIAVLAGAVDGLTNRKAQEAMDQLEEWVRTTAPTLEPHGPGRRGVAVWNPPGAPFPLWFSRWDNGSREDGRIYHGRAMAEDGQFGRVERIGVALDAKCWKLEAARTPHSVTVLVLETNDIQTTNHLVVARATYVAVRQRLSQSNPRGQFPVPGVIVTIDGFDQIEGV